MMICNSKLYYMYYNMYNKKENNINLLVVFEIY